MFVAFERALPWYFTNCAGSGCEDEDVVGEDFFAVGGGYCDGFYGGVEGGGGAEDEFEGAFEVVLESWGDFLEYLATFSWYSRLNGRGLLPSHRRIDQGR